MVAANGFDWLRKDAEIWTCRFNFRNVPQDPEAFSLPQIAHFSLLDLTSPAE